MEKKIMVMGAAILDVLVQPADEEVFRTGSCSAQTITMQTGGDALNEATVLAKMGKSVELLTVLGRDKAADTIREHCRTYGIGLSGVYMDKEMDTGINVVLVDRESERHFLTNAHGTLRALSMEHIPEKFPEDIKILCFASMFVFPKLGGREMAEIFSRAKGQGMILCVDMTKRKNQETVEDIREALSYVDYLLPNYEEAALVTGRERIEEIADAFLDCGVKNVVIKCGKEGCFIKNKEICRMVPAVPGIRSVDSTGAGDCFAAGFVYALSEGMDIEKCAWYGNACGALAVQKVGATGGIESCEQVETVLKGINKSLYSQKQYHFQ